MKLLHRAGMALALTGTLLATSVTAMSPAMAAGLDAISTVKETDKTGARTAATQIPVNFGPEISGRIDVGTGNLSTSMDLEGVSLAHNSLTPVATGTGTRNAWRIGALGAGTLYASSSNVVLIDGTGQKTTFTPKSGSTTDFTAPAEKRYTLKKSSTAYTLLSWDSQSTTHYSLEGLPTKVVDRFGNTTTTAVDAEGTPTRLTGWAGSTTNRNTWIETTAATDTIGIGATEAALARSWKLTTTSGKYSAVTNPRGAQTKISYDSAGRISKVTTADAGYTEIGYDSTGRVTSITTPGIGGSTTNEAVTRFSYPDATKTLVAGADTDPGQAITAVPRTTYSLTTTGQRVKDVTDADGRKASKTYTPQLNTATATTGSGTGASTSKYQYGANNGASMTLATGPSGETSSAEYTDLAANTAYSPDATVDPRGNKTTYTYSGAGALSKSTNALAATAELTYNAKGRVTAATAAGNTGNPTKYEYNTLHQLTRVVPTTGGSIKAEAYVYDDLGRLTKKTTGRGGVTTYAYDGTSSLVTRTASTPAGKTTPDAATDATYDSLGRMTSMTSTAKGTQTQKTTYTYNTRGEITTKKIDQAAVGSEAAQSTTMSFGYSKEGRQTSKAVGGFTTTYAYSPGGTATKVTYPEGTAKKTVSFGVDDQNRRTDTWYGTESSTPEQGWEVHKHTDYDASGNISRQTVKRSGAVAPTTSNPEGIQTLDDKQYCYKPGIDPRQCAGSSVKATDKIQGMYTTLAGTGTGYETRYTYDKAGRLTVVDTPGSAEGRFTYTYDSRGNRVKEVRTTGSETTTDSNTFNAQNQKTSDSWAYDADGNLSTDGKSTSTYNAANQTTGTELEDGSNTTTNTFAGTTQRELIGQESSKKGSYAYTYGLTDRFGNPMIEKITHEGRAAYIEHDPVTDEPLYLRDTDKTSVHMYIADPVDSDIRMVEDDGGSSDYKEFDPFGAREERISPRDKDKFDPYRYRFGLVDHGDTGRYLFGARYYEPTQGVWTQQDSLDSPLDPVNANRYAYAGADPINNYDPTGLYSWAEAGADCVSSAALDAGIAFGLGAVTSGGGAAIVLGGSCAKGALVGWAIDQAEESQQDNLENGSAYIDILDAINDIGKKLL